MIVHLIEALGLIGLLTAFAAVLGRNKRRRELCPSSGGCHT